MVLPSSFHWSEQLAAINDSNVRFNLPPISSTELSNIRHASFPEFAPKSCGDNFPRCGLCDTYKQLRDVCAPNSGAQDKWILLRKIHTDAQEAHRLIYLRNREYSKKNP